MTACAIRYRLDGPGPAAFLVDCEGELRVYARGVLGGTMPRDRLLAVLAERGCRWLPAAGSVELNLEQPPLDRFEISSPSSPLVRPLMGGSGLEAASAAC